MDSQKELAASIVHRFLSLVRHHRRYGALLSEVEGITGRQMAVLQYLVQSGPRTVHDISRHLYVRDATMSPLLERMETAGLLTRRRSAEDSRKVIVEPTERAREMVQRAPLGPMALLRERLPGLPEADLAALDGALKTLSELADVHDEPLDN
ncbi:MAG: MarR family winged helix-turn-helix transcriptional regulator [Anaerolineae bacterium]